MRLFVKSLVAVMAALVLPATMCWGHGASIIQIQVGTDAGSISLLNGTSVGGSKVIADHTEVFDGLGQSIVPGWSFDASLNSTEVRARIVDELLFWDTTNGISATTSETLTLRRLFFDPTPDSAAVTQSSIIDAETIVWDAATVGESHHIMRYEVSGSAPDGAYGVWLQLEDVSGTLGNSAPFLLVLNNGLTTTPSGTAGQPFDSSELGQALTAMTATVPEPASIGLVMSTGLCLVPWAWYRRRRRRVPAEVN